MMKFKLFCFVFISVLFVSCYSGNSSYYIYDEEGKPLFLKMYFEGMAPETLFDCPILSDQNGRFFPISIEFGHWICPYCGILNPIDQVHCVNISCFVGKRLTNPSF